MKFVAKPAPVIVEDNSQKKIITPQGIRVEKNKDKKDAPIEEYVWNTWCDITQRDPDDIPEGALDSIRESLGEEWVNYPRSLMYLLVRQSAYLPPAFIDGKIDDNDTIRLTKTFTSSSHRMAGESAAGVLHTTVIPYHSKESLRSNIDELCDIFHVDNFDNLNHVDQSALISIATSSNNLYDKYMEKLDIMQEEYGSAEKLFDKLSPSEILSELNGNVVSLFGSNVGKRTFSKKGMKKVKRNKATGYQKGREEEESLLSEDMEVDLVASGMIDEGYSKNDIMDFHSSVPRGYWQSVLDIVYDPHSPGYGDPESAYDIVQKEFNFHPDDRIKPEFY